jgi:hypothetical protein
MNPLNTGTGGFGDNFILNDLQLAAYRASLSRGIHGNHGPSYNEEFRKKINKNRKKNKAARKVRKQSRRRK